MFHVCQWSQFKLSYNYVHLSLCYFPLWPKAQQKVVVASSVIDLVSWAGEGGEVMRYFCRPTRKLTLTQYPGTSLKS